MITNPVKAIRAHCLQCCCGQVAEVQRCTIENCALYPFRFGKNPYRAHTPRMLQRGDGEENAAKRIAVDEKIFPIKDADIYLTNVDSERTADVIYKFLMQE